MEEYVDEFKALLAFIDPTKSTQDNSSALERISIIWDKYDDDNIRATEYLKGNTIFPVLAQVMEENYSEWKEAFPAWISTLLNASRTERDVESELFPIEHLDALVIVFRKYLLAGCGKCISAFRYLVLFSGTKQLLLSDDVVYNIIKSDLRMYQLLFLSALTGCDQWKLKILADHRLILDLLGVTDARASSTVWDVFFYLAHHPDAKRLLPKDVIVKVSQSIYSRRIELCALLCCEDDLTYLKLEASVIAKMEILLRNLITKGAANAHSLNYNLLNTILPIVKLSVVDHMKGALGSQFIPLLMQVITGDLPDTMYTTKHIPRARREASKALWNFAFADSNHAHIAKDNGVEKISNVLLSSEDPVLKKNIAAIMHMITVRNDKQLARGSGVLGHVMISHNCADHAIIKRIANNLQGHGYIVWTGNIEQYDATLEAIVEAIEQSDMILMCMSQKYKESANLRLEVEYSITRKIPLISLMMQKGYTPAGWVSAVLGSKLYYEFSDEENWDFKIKELIKAIGNFEKKATC